ncbi:Conserved_hypothetical protein [Hexamita inflata]|uniref:CCAAT-binding factor domain-containing protein n=1 Tax=Hexamita inflata TaxID=28002 RepID=A0ABP1JT40_9EUKA
MEEVIIAIKSDVNNHKQAIQLLNKDYLSQLTQMNKYFMQNNFLLSLKEDNFYTKFFNQSQQLLLDQILEKNKKALICYMNLLQVCSETVSLTDNDVILTDKSVGQGVFPISQFFDLLKVVLNAPIDILNYFVELLQTYTDLYYFTVMFMHKTISQHKQLKNYFKVLAALSKIEPAPEHFIETYKIFAILIQDTQKFTQMYGSHVETEKEEPELKEQVSKDEALKQRLLKSITNRNQNNFRLLKLNFDHKSIVKSTVQLLLKDFTGNQQSDTRQVFTLDLINFVDATQIDDLIKISDYSDYYSLICVNLIVQISNTCGYSYLDFHRKLYKLITPECFQFANKHILVDLLESVILSPSTALKIRINFLKKVAQTAVLCSADNQLILTHLIIYSLHKAEELRFMARPTDYIFIKQADFEESQRIYNELEENNELMNVKLTELSVLQHSSCTEVSVLVNQLLKGELENNYLIYQQIKKIGLNSLVQKNLNQQFGEGSHFGGEPSNVIQKHLIPEAKQGESYEKELTYMTPQQLINEIAIEKAGGDVMLQNLVNGAKIQVSLDLERELFKGFEYEAGEVWSKVAPRTKEGEEELQDQGEEAEENNENEILEELEPAAEEYEEEEEEECEEEQE